MPKRQGNNPKRRILPRHEADAEALRRLSEEASYTGSAHHKRMPADYGFQPPVNPRPNKSLCDGRRTIRLHEARRLFHKGLRYAMVSAFWIRGFPKYVWAVDDYGHAYEAKLELGTRNYHGYELGDNDDAMRQLVIEEWRKRCRPE